MKVKIKTWEKMEKEFGLNGGWINCEGYFTPTMENGMPQDRVIDVQYLEDFMEWNRWEISDDMIEEYFRLG